MNSRATPATRQQPVLEGVRVGAGLARRPATGDVTYTIVEVAPSVAKPAEQRAGQRWRTRLRSGKLADSCRRFVIECIFHDRSSDGARLRLVEDVALPKRLMVYDDETETLASAHIVWRDRQVVGIRFEPRSGTSAGTETGASPLGANFYAMPRAPRAR